MIDVRELERLEAKQRDTHWYEATNPLVGQMRNALPAFLRFVNAMREWDYAMRVFSEEQARFAARGQVIPLDWSLENCQRVQDKLDTAMAIFHAEFSWKEE